MPLTLLFLIGAPSATDENGEEGLAATYRRLNSQRQALSGQRDRLAAEAGVAQSSQPYLIVDLPGRLVTLRMASVTLRECEIGATAGPQRHLGMATRRIVGRRYPSAAPARVDTATADTADVDTTVTGVPGGDPTPGDTTRVDSGAVAGPPGGGRLEVALEGDMVLHIHSEAQCRPGLPALYLRLADRLRCLAGRGGCDDLRVVVGPDGFRWLDAAVQPGRAVLLFGD
ncbi:MAG: hypothetical protein ABIL09_19950 [Gemmatimonadota bacterium]